MVPEAIFGLGVQWYHRSMDKLTRKRVIVTSAWVVGSLIVVVVAIIAVSRLTGVNVANATNVIQGLITVLAIVVGGGYAFYKLEAFREFEPHLTIAQVPSHRRIGGSYIYISVDVSLANNSKVAIRIREGSFWMQLVAPLNNEEVETLYADFRNKPLTDKYVEFQTIEKFNRQWGENEFVIEPGESSADRYEFIIADEFDTVTLGAFFVDSTKTSRAPRTGWSAITLYDINEDKETVS